MYILSQLPKRTSFISFCFVFFFLLIALLMTQYNTWTYSTPHCPSRMTSVPAPILTFWRSFCVDTTEVSDTQNIPWVSITQIEAQEQCKKMGKHLITNSEWQLLARDIERVGWNWSGGAPGVGQMSDGHSDNYPPHALPSVITNNPCAGTGNVCDLQTWHSQRRVYQLSNGEYIWDFGGNVYEWVDATNENNHPVPNTGPKEWLACHVQEHICGNTLPTNDVWFRGDTADTRAFRRGGFWVNGEKSGAFTLTLSNTPHESFTYVGFRCAQ